MNAVNCNNLLFIIHFQKTAYNNNDAYVHYLILTFLRKYDIIIIQKILCVLKHWLGRKLWGHRRRGAYSPPLFYKKDV